MILFAVRTQHCPAPECVRENGPDFPIVLPLWHPSPPVLSCPSGPRGCGKGPGPGDILPASLQTDPAVLGLGSEGALRDVCLLSSEKPGTSPPLLPRVSRTEVPMTWSLWAGTWASTLQPMFVMLSGSLDTYHQASEV